MRRVMRGTRTHIRNEVLSVTELNKLRSPPYWVRHNCADYQYGGEEVVERGETLVAAPKIILQGFEKRKVYWSSSTGKL